MMALSYLNVRPKHSKTKSEVTQVEVAMTPSSPTSPKSPGTVEEKSFESSGVPRKILKYSLGGSFNQTKR